MPQMPRSHLERRESELEVAVTLEKLLVLLRNRLVLFHGGEGRGWIRPRLGVRATTTSYRKRGVTSFREEGDTI